MTWSVAVWSFIGALIGAGIPAWVALRGQRQRAREEWRRRLDRAVDLALADRDQERRVGEELLADLINSNLGSQSDRDLAQRISRIQVAEQDRSTSVSGDGGTEGADRGE